MAGADGAGRRPGKRTRRGGRRDQGVFVLLAFLICFAIAAACVSLLKAGVADAAKKDAQAAQGFAQTAETFPAITFTPETTEAICGGSEPPTAVPLEDGPPYFDEVTDPDFHGYPEIDHSAVPCPVTEDEIVELAKVMYSEANVVRWSGTRWGVSYKARQAAVGWVAFNRLDSKKFGDTLHEVLTAPYQFAYHPDAPVTDEMLELARDVVARWWRECQGELDVGRVIDPEFMWFEGDGRENYFRAAYEKTGTVWDWSLPDPYAEEG